MSFLQAKVLEVVEKFRAPAALYRPSKRKGDGWIELSGPSLGGEVMIQVQQDAQNKSSGRIPVVRFQLRHKKDIMNARILPGLPIERKGGKTVLFKSVSSNSGGERKKTIYALKFETKDKTDDFIMWWLAKNGSTPLGYETKTSSKRKAEDRTNCGRGSGYTPMKKKSKPTKRDAETKVVLKDSTNSGQKKASEVREDEGKIPVSKNSIVTSTTPTSKKSSANTNVNDSPERDNDKQEIVIDDDYAPASQDWFAAFVDDCGHESE